MIDEGAIIYRTSTENHAADDVDHVHTYDDTDGRKLMEAARVEGVLQIIEEVNTSGKMVKRDTVRFGVRRSYRPVRDGGGGF